MTLYIETERLILREWREEDFLPYHQMNADPVVRKFFPSVQSETVSRECLRHFKERGSEDGYCFQPLIEKHSGKFVGDIGLAVVGFDGPLKGSTEIGWMMHREFWGKGYVTEMGKRLLEEAFSRLALPEVLAFTIPANKKSQRVMARLGMEQDLDGSFDHPNLAEDHPMRPHVLYRKTAPCGA